jgi:type IV secretory pathway VirB3-like protein
MKKNFGISYLTIGLVGLITTIVFTVINGPATATGQALLILVAFIVFTSMSVFGFMAFYESRNNKE